jgi:perosamine synthetase
MSRIPWWYTHLDDAERDRLVGAFDARRLSLGAIGAEFEERFASLIGARHAIVTPSGTAALTMAMIAHGVGPGDEVIVPDLTWIATAQAVSIVGATPVPVDCTPDMTLIDISAIESHITSKTKGIIPVHMNGRPCHVQEIRNIARKHGLFVVEDVCKAMASEGPDGYLGTYGDIGCFSLGMISLVSAGYGGIAVTDDPDLYERLLSIRDHGVHRGADEHYATAGFNFKVSDLLMAIAIAQLEKVDTKKAHLTKVYERYADGLNGHEFVSLIPVNVESGQVSLLIDVRTHWREDLIAHLQSHEVDVSRFHQPVHRAYSGETLDTAFPNATAFSREGFVLPCGPSQPLENVDSVVEILNEWRPA